jgi:superfamily II DNA/RNA helicase
MHEKLDKVMSMIFVNKKETALKLQARLKNVNNITSHVLIGGIEAAERDKIIDGFRK